MMIAASDGTKVSKTEEMEPKKQCGKKELKIKKKEKKKKLWPHT